MQRYKYSICNNQFQSTRRSLYTARTLFKLYVWNRQTIEQLAEQMQEITDIAIKGLGNWVKIDDRQETMITEAKGILPCPWPHPKACDKRVTTVKLIKSGQSIAWSDLNIHLIREHGFFEGVGSSFRLERKELIEMLL